MDATMVLDNYITTICMIAFLACLLLAFIAIPTGLVTRYVFKRKLLSRPEVTEYTPPTNLTPAELGMLLKTDATDNTFIATLYDLKRRGTSNKLNETTMYNFERTAFGYYQQLCTNNDPITAITELPGYGNALLQFAKELEVHMRTKHLVGSRNYKYAIVAIATIVLFVNSLLIAKVQGIVNNPAMYNNSLQPLHVASQVAITNFVVIVFAAFPILLFKLSSGDVTVILKGKRSSGTDWDKLRGYVAYLKMVEKERANYEIRSLSNKISNEHIVFLIGLGLVDNANSASTWNRYN